MFIKLLPFILHPCCHILFIAEELHILKNKMYKSHENDNNTCLCKVFDNMIDDLRYFFNYT